jgi:hypothetical protein
MASTYSALKIELIGTGEQSGTWGTTTNTNLGDSALGEAITGSADVAFSSGTVTLTLTDTNASQTARNLRLNLTGTSGGAQNLIVPAIEKLYLVNNGCADAITVKNASGTGIAVPAGKSMFVFNTGANVVDAVTHATSLTLGSALPVASGGTGTTSTTFANLTTNVTGTLPIANGGTGATTLTANNVIIGNGTSAPTFVAPGTNGNVLTSNGTTWTSATITSFVAGMIIMWSGTIATIPSGWLLCNGSSGTPDLRDKFIIGANADSGGAAKTNITGTPSQTGGSKDASLPSHTHTATVTDPGHTHTLSPGLRASNGTDGNPNRCSGGSDNGAISISTATTGITVANSTEGVSATNANLVPYFALAFIMKS